MKKGLTCGFSPFLSHFRHNNCFASVCCKVLFPMRDVMVMISKNKFDEKNCSISIRFQYNNSGFLLLLLSNVFLVVCWNDTKKVSGKNCLNIVIITLVSQTHQYQKTPYTNVIILPKLLHVHFFSFLSTQIFFKWVLHKISVGHTKVL